MEKRAHLFRNSIGIFVKGFLFLVFLSELFHAPATFDLQKDLKFVRNGPKSYFDRAPEAFPVLSLRAERLSNGSIVKVSSTSDYDNIKSNPTDPVDVNLYRNSVAVQSVLRSSTSLHPITQHSHLTLHSAFQLLDTIVDYTQNRSHLPKLFFFDPLHAKLPQQIRYNAQVKSKFTHSFMGWMLSLVVEQSAMQSVRSCFYSNTDRERPLQICKRKFDRPLLCELGIFTPFSNITNVNFSRLQSFGTVVNQRFQSFQQRYPNSTVDMTLMEAYQNPIGYTIGGAYKVTFSFEISMLLRVRDCSRTHCITQIIDDYRFKASSLKTDYEDYVRLIRFLRTLAQFYCWVRVVFLFMGLYVAQCKLFPDVKCRCKMTLEMFFYQVPYHAVVYGSILPVSLQSLAHYTDFQITYHVSKLKLYNQGSSFVDKIQAFSMLMRISWVAALLGRLVLKIVFPRNQNRGYVFGFHGYLIGVLSLMSIAVNSWYQAFWETSILHTSEAFPNSLRFRRQFNLFRDKSGFYGYIRSDICNLFLCSIFYTIFVHLSKKIKKCYNRFLCIPIQDKNKWEIFIAATKQIPSSCHELWGSGNLSIQWALCFINNSHTQQQKSTIPRHMLMNIVFLTDPLNYVILRCGFCRANLYIYRNKKSNKLLIKGVRNIKCEKGISIMNTDDKGIHMKKHSNYKYQFIKAIPVANESWWTWIKCR